MNTLHTQVEKKLAAIAEMQIVIMSELELDYMAYNDMHPAEVVSLPNPRQVGILDAYIVGHKSCEPFVAKAQENALETSARRFNALSVPNNPEWDEPAAADSLRGWYWPAKTTKRGQTVCAGHYLQYPEGYRTNAKEVEAQPGLIHCVSVSTCGISSNFRWVETVEEARKWLEAEGKRLGHS